MRKITPIFRPPPKMGPGLYRAPASTGHPQKMGTENGDRSLLGDGDTARNGDRPPQTPSRRQREIGGAARNGSSYRGHQLLGTGHSWGTSYRGQVTTGAEASSYRGPAIGDRSLLGASYRGQVSTAQERPAIGDSYWGPAIGAIGDRSLLGQKRPAIGVQL